MEVTVTAEHAGPTMRPGQIPAPADILGYPVGAERKIPDWPLIVAFFHQLAAASDRVSVEELGRTTDDNPLLVVAISAPANLARRDELRQINARLFDPRNTPADEVPTLLAAGRTVALILCTQHSNELGAALMSLELAHDLATRNDPATQLILEQTITLIVPCANPDGHRMVVEWYNRWLDTPYEGQPLPKLYHRYVGHDNNRDWFMLTQAETRLIAALHNREHPQLVFDMHQMGRDGARFMLPPFIDPLDPNQDPVIQAGFADVGTTIAAKLTAAGKTGVATHIIFDNYSPSLAYGNYHGSVDLLSEAASCKFATPVDLKEEDLKERRGFNPQRRSWNHPKPWTGGKWTLRDIVEYDKIAALAFLEHAARDREGWLRQFADLQRRTIERSEAPFAYLFPQRQDDPLALAELLDTLARGAVEIAVATAPFVADGVQYEAGTRVVLLQQPAGNFAKTLLEIQRYPDLRLWPDGPPQPPYDIAGHTLPLQMGVAWVEVKATFAVTTTPLVGGSHAVGTVEGVGLHGYAIAPTANRATEALNRLLVAGHRVFRSRGRLTELGLPPGTILVPTTAAATTLDQEIASIAAQVGVEIRGLESPLQAGSSYAQALPRLGLYQSWRPVIDEGWTRFILEEYGFPYTTLHDNDIRNGELAARFDTILLPSQSREDLLEGNKPKDDWKDPYPPEYVGGLGELGVAALREFVENGGTLIALDAACEAIIKGFWLPVRDMLEGLDRKEFYCPGSLLRIIVDPAHPLGWGLRREETAVFVNSPAFQIAPGDGTTVARYPLSDPNLSGWLLGHQHLAGRSALVEVPLGHGRVILVGFRCQFRAQARGTYKVLFNAIYRGALREVIEE